MFMPPSSHQFSLLFSLLHFSPFSPLSPPVNYLLSVRLGQKLHFPPDETEKSLYPLEFSTGEEAEKMLIRRRCS